VSALERLRDALWRHNPLYLASAACMLEACYLLTGADSRATSGLGQVLPILAWLTLYEATLIGFGGFLMRRGLGRDARMLLVIEAIFIADFTNLTAETVAFSDQWGRVTIGLLLLAAGKVALACAAYRLRPRPSELAWAAGALSAILLLPSLCRELARYSADLELPLYGAAWIVGALVMIWALRDRAATSPLTAGLNVVLPLSLGAHVIALHWQYGVPFHLSSLSPTLLALGVVAIRRLGPERPILRLVLPAWAILFARDWAEACVLDYGAGPTFSPLRATLVVAAAVLLYDIRRYRQLASVVAAYFCVFVALAGHSYAAAIQNVLHVVDLVTGRAAGLVPRTRRHWGAVIMAAAWICLALAGWISLRGRPRSA